MPPAIALIGYGKMGHEIEHVAKIKEIPIAAIIDPLGPAKEITKETLNGADVAVDFSVPDAVIDHVRDASKLGVNIVVATTGWYNRMDEAKRIVAEHGTGMIYSPNFSIGVNLYFRIVEEAARLMDKAPDYDIYAYEGHHNQKLDSPSGTAKAVADILVRNIGRKKRPVFDKLDRKILPEELHVASFRAGFHPGTHTVGFDSEADTIELTHTARNRAGFATGALAAAQWIRGKKGFFTMQDFMNDVFT